MLRLIVIALTLCVLCGHAHATNVDIQSLPCRSEARNGVWYILEGVGQDYQSHRDPGPQTAALYEEIRQTRTILGIPEEVLVLVTDCPMQGHNVRTVRNPMQPIFQLYIVERLVPMDEYSRQQIASHEVCLIRLGLASDNNRDSRLPPSHDMTRCRLIIEQGRNPLNAGAVSYFQQLLPPGDHGTLPPYRPTVNSPIHALENALRAFGRLPPESIPPAARGDLRRAQERLRELRSTFD